VNITIADDRVVVTVEDDGRGVSGATRASGTENLAVRAASRGGHFLLEARSPQGTKATWSVPLSADEAS
jgi:signal transduction histidine kinase